MLLLSFEIQHCFLFLSFCFLVCEVIYFLFFFFFSSCACIFMDISFQFHLLWRHGGIHQSREKFHSCLNPKGSRMQPVSVLFLHLLFMFESLLAWGGSHVLMKITTTHFHRYVLPFVFLTGLIGSWKHLCYFVPHTVNTWWYSWRPTELCCWSFLP